MTDAAAVTTRWKTHVAVGALVFALAFAFAVSWGWDIADESWLLNVANRVASGEVPYRDVFLQVTPLSLYIMVLFIKLFGAQMIIFKAVNALVFSGVVLLASRIGDQLGSQKRYSAALILSIFFLGSPARLQLMMFYSQVANFFLLATFSLWLSWQAMRDNRLIVAAGIAVGLCFAAKQNVGTFAALALVASTVALAWGERKSVFWTASAIARAGSAGVATALVALLPVALNGGLPRLVEFGLSGTGSYLTRGSMWYFKPVYSLVELVHHPGGIGALRWINAAIPFLLPVLLLPLLTAVLEQGERERVNTISVAAFTAAAMATLYPRADPQHMIFVAPMVLLALRYGWRELTRETTTLWIPFAGTLAVAAVSAGLFAMTASAIGRVRSPDNVWSDLPHHRGLLIPAVTEDRLTRNLRALPVLPNDGRTFLIMPHAGFYYLAGGLHNPTRYDYPYAVALGENGVAEIETAIRDGRIARVCMDPGGVSNLKAHDLDQYVRTNMVHQPVPDFCEEYTQRGAAGLQNAPR